METTLRLDATHFRMAIEKARLLGITLETYLHRLIDADNLSFDELLLPVRKEFESMSDREIDELFDRAIHAVRRSTSSE